MKILIDMNLCPAFVAFLRAEGYEAVHWSSIGAAATPDSSIMDYARAHDFVVLTHDRDFGVMAAASRGAKPSIAQFRCRDVMAEAIWRQLLRALRETWLLPEVGAIVTVGLERVRVRALPFGPIE